MIVLQAGTEGCRDRQPFSDIHRVVAVIVISPVSKFSSVGPIVLDHVYPPTENPGSEPHNQRKFQTSDEPPHEAERGSLRDDGENRVRDYSEGARFQDVIGGQIFLAPIGQETEI